MMKQNNNRAKPKSGRRKTKKNQGVDGVPGLEVNALTRLPLTVSNIMPDRLYTRLTYNGSKAFVTLTGASQVAYRWTPSAAYDIDPLLGSTTTVGYTEISAFYNNYRVLASTLKIQSATQATVGCTAVILPLNADPGATPSNAVVASWFNNPYNKRAVMRTAGSPTRVISRKMSTEKIYGSKTVYFDDNFASLTNTVPNNNWYWAVATVYSGAVAANQTVLIEVDITIDVEFYSRKVLLN